MDPRTTKIIVAIVIVVIIVIVIAIVSWPAEEGFRADPSRVKSAAPLLKNPNSFDAFREHVCEDGTDSCVDAVDYMDARKLVTSGKFTDKNIEKLLA